MKRDEVPFFINRLPKIHEHNVTVEYIVELLEIFGDGNQIHQQQTLIDIYDIKIYRGSSLPNANGYGYNWKNHKCYEKNCYNKLSKNAEEKIQRKLKNWGFYYDATERFIFFKNEEDAVMAKMML
jgi:hypothetical protein